MSRRPDRCMRSYCEDLRWNKFPNENGTFGQSVLCQFHSEEVLRGEAKAPPLRQNIDYISTGRKCLLVKEHIEEKK